MIGLFGKFEFRRKLFEFLLREKIPIYTVDGEGRSLYCDPAQVPSEAMGDLAIILADITFDCDLMLGEARGG